MDSILESTGGGQSANVCLVDDGAMHGDAGWRGVLPVELSGGKRWSEASRTERIKDIASTQGLKRGEEMFDTLNARWMLGELFSRDLHPCVMTWSFQDGGIRICEKHGGLRVERMWSYNIGGVIWEIVKLDVPDVVGMGREEDLDGDITDGGGGGGGQWGEETDGEKRDACVDSEVDGEMDGAIWELGGL